MAQRPICSICEKRRAERFCPAKGERICSVCCATEREVRLDCPVDCSYLIAAHRYEQEHRQPLAPSKVPFASIELSSDLLYKNEAFLSGLGYALLKFSTEHRDLADGDIFTALEALAETYRTLVSGIYYEKPPSAPLAAALYAVLAGFMPDYKKQESSQKGFTALKDSDIFHSLVYLARVCRMSSNGRPRARIFLELLRAQYPQQQELQPQTSRIIAP
jgi:hypothetical protein